MNKQRYVINLYFGFEREWCWYFAYSKDEAEEYANDWSSCYIVQPDVISVYLSPE